MAVLVPVLMAAAGAGTVATMITTVAFAVTGISAKINKAAASVFGEDLVKVGNMFGAAYGAFTGGTFGFDGGVTDPSSINAVNGMDQASDAFNASGATGPGGFGFGSLADRAGDAATAGTDYLSGTGDELTELGDAGGYGYTPEAESNVVDLLNPASELAGDPMTVANETGRPASLIPGTGAASTQASGANAAGTNATGSQAAQANAAATDAAAQVQGQAPVTPPASPPASQGFFGRLGNMVLDKNGQLTNAGGRMVGGVLQGVGGGYAAAMKAKQEREMFDQKMAEQRRMQSQSTGTRVTR